MIINKDLSKHFHNFINSLSSIDKIAIIAHNDLDGMASTILMEEVIKKKGIKIKFIGFYQYSSKVLEEITNDLKKNSINKVFVLDLNLDNINKKLFSKFREEFAFLIIDHHPANPLFKKHKSIIKTDSYDCSALTTYFLINSPESIKKWLWLISSAMISDCSYRKKANLEFLKKYYPEITEKNILNSAPSKLANKISSILIFFKTDLIKAYNLIKKGKFDEFDSIHKEISKEISKFVSKFEKESKSYSNKNLRIYYFNPKFDVSNIITTKASFNNPNEIFVGISDDGASFLKISIRDQSGNKDTNNLIKESIKKLRDSSGGGHKNASGGRIRKEDFNKFIDNLLRYS